MVPIVYRSRFISQFLSVATPYVYMDMNSSCHSCHIQTAETLFILLFRMPISVTIELRKKTDYCGMSLTAADDRRRHGYSQVTPGKQTWQQEHLASWSE